jgi:DNA-binding response OmpR family regulator
MYGGHTVSILVVEDDPAVAELLRALLNRVTGWGATVVHDAAAAREVFAHVRVEAMVLDVNLPGISGLELLDLLEDHPNWHDPAVILTSANTNQPEIAAALVRHPNARFIPKPFDVDEVVDAIEQLLSPSPTQPATGTSAVAAVAAVAAVVKDARGARTTRAA